MESAKCEQERGATRKEEVAKVSTSSSSSCGAGEDRICNGKYIVMDRGDQQRLLVFNSQQTISFGKGSTQQDVLLKQALGKPFLSAFRASPAPPEIVSEYNLQKDRNKNPPWKKSKGRATSTQNIFVLEESTESAAKIINEFYQLPDTVSSGTDNRNIVDDNSSQQLKTNDIKALREQGVPSREILDAILTSSKSFSQKTEFSQEKYLKKKEKIYGDVLVFRKPSISILADYYFKRDPHKVLGLRPDSLSQILSYANVHANGKHLIYENCGGLVVAAVLHRLGGQGVAFHCHIGNIPQRQALVCMNYTDQDLGPLKSLDMTYLLNEGTSGGAAAANDSEKAGEIATSSSDEPQAKKQKLDQVKADEDVDSNGKEVDSTQDEESSSYVPSKKLRHINNKVENEESLGFFNETQFDSLIICGKEHPLTLFQRLLPRTSPSSPFVIYCQHPEPLMDCYVWSKEKGVGCNVHLVDNWFRNIQVETERTHPEIQMSPSGGYLLYGTYTESA